MGAIIGFLVTKGLSPKVARIVAIGGLVVLLLVAMAGAKCAYDRSVIKAHDAKREAAVAKADRKADAKAAEQRRVDDARTTTESQEIKETINEARSEGRDPRAAYYACVRLQQAARREHKPPPEC